MKQIFLPLIIFIQVLFIFYIIYETIIFIAVLRHHPDADIYDSITTIMTALLIIINTLIASLYIFEKI